MLRADRFTPGRPPRAVYFFTGAPNTFEQLVNVTAVRTQVTVQVRDVHGPLYRRWDGCIALTESYRGAAQVAELTCGRTS